MEINYMEDRSIALILSEIAFTDHSLVLELRQPLVNMLFKNGVDDEMQEYLLEEDEICRLFVLYESRDTIGTAEIRPTLGNFMLEWIVIRKDKQGLGFGSWVVLECIRRLKGRHYRL